MRIAAPRTSDGGTLKREQLTSERLRAATLRLLFPHIERLRIELVFSDPKARFAPSPQLHTLYAAAPAFFRFACPCADCDGDFDLTGAVTTLLTDSPARAQTAASLGGQMLCGGVRFRDRAAYQSSCSMQLNFQLQFDARRAG